MKVLHLMKILRIAAIHSRQQAGMYDRLFFKGNAESKCEKGRIPILYQSIFMVTNKLVQLIRGDTGLSMDAFSSYFVATKQTARKRIAKLQNML